MRSISSLRSLICFTEMDVMSENQSVQTLNRPPLHTVTWNRALSPGTSSQLQADLVSAPKRSSRGTTLESKADLL